jgi:hypothetical protein
MKGTMPTQTAFEIIENAADSILTRAKDLNLEVRLLGSLAIKKRCPLFYHHQLRKGRDIKDIDLIGYFKDKAKIDKLFETLGYEPDPRLATIPGIRRSIFYSPEGKFRCDVFFDAMEFCHHVDLSKRLCVDKYTIPLMELLLLKLQIVDITYKDITDVQVLLLEHAVGDTDSNMINGRLLSTLCSKDWGLWYTVTANLKGIYSRTRDDDELTVEHKNKVMANIERLKSTIDSVSKSHRWRLRSLIGAKLLWYTPVEDFADLDRVESVRRGQANA